MRRIIAAASAAALMLVLALPLSGCFATSTIEDTAKDIADVATSAADAAQGLADSATEWADALKSIDAGKISRMVVIDAQSGATIAEITDQPTVEQVIAPLSGMNGLAGEPDAPAEYRFEIWQPRTVLTGETADDAEDVKVLELATFAGSDVIKMTITLINLSICFDSPATAEELRALA